jgi:predicted AAA+ superfamily ATPase
MTTEPVFLHESHLKKIRPFCHDTDIIKVLTGVRRCGKSCVMQMLAEELVAQCVPDDHIVHLPLDRRPFRKVRTSG